MATAKKTKSKPKASSKKVPAKTKSSTKAAKAVKKSVKKTTARKAPAKRATKKTSPKKSNIDISDFSNFSSTFQPYKSKKNEKYMNANQKKHFENILQAWKDALHEEQEKTENLIQNDQGNFPDSVDRASKEEEFMLELRKRDRERKLISKIEQSMKDLSDNFYGFCETCGIEIGIKRLEARPTATQCIDCKTIEEIKEKQQYG
uniref:DnaK suppressor protein n=1 Tax=uncultured gamma proteobacterium HF0010_10D20 TaxID=723561 RepID=E7C1L6_9GAMM|nr:DnaK suppressor protein [uncultured gamma proteobacterium HF0010_10D20]